MPLIVTEPIIEFKAEANLDGLGGADGRTGSRERAAGGVVGTMGEASELLEVANPLMVKLLTGGGAVMAGGVWGIISGRETGVWSFGTLEGVDPTDDNDDDDELVMLENTEEQVEDPWEESELGEELKIEVGASWTGIEFRVQVGLVVGMTSTCGIGRYDPNGTNVLRPRPGIKFGTVDASMNAFFGRNLGGVNTSETDANVELLRNSRLVIVGSITAAQGIEDDSTGRGAHGGGF